MLFTNNPQPMWVFDLRSLQILAMNDAAQAQYGFTGNEFADKTARELVPAQDTQTFLADVAQPANGGQPRGVWRQLRTDGSTFEVEVRAMDLRYPDRLARLILATNHTPQRSDSALQQEQKMELIGSVVTAVARHVENLPGDISTETDFLLSKAGDSEIGESLKRISTAAVRASAVTQHLLMVGAQRSIETQALDFNRFLTRLEPTIRRIIGSSVSFEKHYAADRLFIMADSRLLEHIVVNLVLNAREAMPTGGTLSFRTSTAHFNRSSSGGRDKDGVFVRLAVRDSGCGMSAEAGSRLFEPFFATRQTGESRGLGLASSYGAAKQLGGWIDVASAIGSGTEFSIYFPSCPAPATATEPKGGSSVSKTILLVEPDSRIRTMARTALEWNGYRVVETDSASLAITLWPGRAESIDLLLTEIALPEAVSGRQLAEQLSSAKPALKVLYMHDSSNRSDGVEQLKPEELLSKPFTSVDLLECISRRLPELS
jgi:PAS domain S-box-containing protein